MNLYLCLKKFPVRNFGKPGKFLERYPAVLFACFCFIVSMVVLVLYSF